MLPAAFHPSRAFFAAWAFFLLLLACAPGESLVVSSIAASAADTRVEAAGPVDENPGRPGIEVVTANEHLLPKETPTPSEDLPTPLASVAFMGSPSPTPLTLTPVPTASPVSTPTPTLAPPLRGRSYHSTIWTGDTGNPKTTHRMIVWGGFAGNGAQTDTGGIYDPATDTWKPLSQLNAPHKRSHHLAVWASNRMVVWGGYTEPYGEKSLDTGGIYDPETDTWTPTSLQGAPVGRMDYHAMVTDGRNALIWAGDVKGVPSWEWANDIASPVTAGAILNPVANTWTTIPRSANEHYPMARYSAAAWSGSEFVLWGGLSSWGAGSVFNPLTRLWRKISQREAPRPRLSGFPSVWTGKEMFVWGGFEASFTGVRAGGLYNPTTDSWKRITDAGAPSARQYHGAVWVGDRVFLWGGYADRGATTRFNDGAFYDPNSDKWTLVSAGGSPASRSHYYGTWLVWTGDTGIARSARKVLMWGEEDRVGQIFDVDALSWSKMSEKDQPP